MACSVVVGALWFVGCGMSGMGPPRVDVGCPGVATQVLAKHKGRSLVVHSEEGMDKISPVANTHSWLVEYQKEPEYKLLTPADFGLSHAPGTPCGEGVCVCPEWHPW